MLLTADTAQLISNFTPVERDVTLHQAKINLALLLSGDKLGIEWHAFSPKFVNKESVLEVNSELLTQLRQLFNDLGVLYGELGPAVIDAESNGQPGYKTRIVFRLATNKANLNLVEEL